MDYGSIEKAYKFIRNGNLEIGRELISEMVENSYNGFNKLHLDVLSTDGKKLEKVLRVSAMKKSDSINRILPIALCMHKPDP